jgi:hypothetical protein
MTSRFAVTIFLFTLVAGCATDEQVHKSTTMTDGSNVYAIKCSDIWGDCYLQAQRICASGNFTEIDRHSTQGVTNSGRITDEQNGFSKTGIYKEDLRTQEHGRVLTIRCD